MNSKKGHSRRKSRIQKDKEPKVGIIFVVRDEILIRSMPTVEGEIYGDSINHPMGHDQFWADLQLQGKVPRDEEYIGVPRGRVLYSNRTGQYFLLLDRCILKKPKIVREIRKRMNLPSRSLHVSTDDHYRCSLCLEGQNGNE